MSSRAPREASLYEILDEPEGLTPSAWRDRNRRLYEALVKRALIDRRLLPERTVEFLSAALITEDNPAATDPQNAGHVRAQNENILHFGLILGVAKETLSIALGAGFIHDLNKATGQPLRRDRYAVRTRTGAVHPSMRTVAERVGLNHLGDWTRTLLEDACRLRRGALEPEVAAQLDAVIVHHGLGSSRFIQRLIDGDNAWWGSEFVEVETGQRKLIHPPQPPLTLASVIHDLADSTQQMQAGVAWLNKYPSGFWKDAGRSYFEMLAANSTNPGKEIAMSLADQVEVEVATCRSIIAEARLNGLVDDRGAQVLARGLVSAVAPTRAWIDDSERSLSRPAARTVFHEVAAGLGVSPNRALAMLRDSGPGTAKARRVEPFLMASARSLDIRRARGLARLIESRSARAR
ncbi:MAG: hypothetical protein U1E65_18055 [Myxococcota bacterium]